MSYCCMTLNHIKSSTAGLYSCNVGQVIWLWDSGKVTRFSVAKEEFSQVKLACHLKKRQIAAFSKMCFCHLGVADMCMSQN